MNFFARSVVAVNLLAFTAAITFGFGDHAETLYYQNHFIEPVRRTSNSTARLLVEKNDDWIIFRLATSRQACVKETMKFCVCFPVRGEITEVPPTRCLDGRIGACIRCKKNDKKTQCGVEKELLIPKLTGVVFDFMYSTRGQFIVGRDLWGYDETDNEQRSVQTPEAIQAEIVGKNTTDFDEVIFMNLLEERTKADIDAKMQEWIQEEIGALDGKCEL